MPTLPKNFVTRLATLEDAEAAVELVNACSVELTGTPEFDLNRFRTDWSSPTLNPQTDLHLVFTPDKRLVGYAGVWDSEPYAQLYGWGNVHPEYRGQGIGTYLAHWVEARPRLHPQGAGGRAGGPVAIQAQHRRRRPGAAPAAGLPGDTLRL